jgi:hypothetical protein
MRPLTTLPLNGRDYKNLLGLRPGVMMQPGGSPWTQSTNNIRPDETVWYCMATSQCSIAAVHPNLRNPYVINYDLGVQHAFANDFSLEIGYVGNHDVRLTGQRDINQPILPALNPSNTPYAAQYPYLLFINQFSNFARSNYNSFQATLNKRVSHGVDFTAGYTYGHGLDNGSLSRFGGLPQDSTNPAAEYGNSDYDTRHRFTFRG